MARASSTSPSGSTGRRLRRLRRRFGRSGIEFRFSDHGACHSVYFKDPDGHQIELTTYEV